MRGGMRELFDEPEDETDGTDVMDGLERPPFWNDGLERDLRARVAQIFDDMVGKARGDDERRRQCELAYAELSAAVNDKYKELNGKDLPAGVAQNLDQLLMQITTAPAGEPEHGPGLWAKVPQTGIKSMVEARPIDLTGSPTRVSIDLMMLHAIRMGRFLTTHYTDWARTLPECWIRHDEIVMEVYALKCYMDLVSSSPNGGFYAPTLQSLIRAALDRVKAYLDASDASAADHAHHLSATEDRRREQARHDEYARWFDRTDAWSAEPPFDPSWGFDGPDQGLERTCDLIPPVRGDDTTVDGDGTLRARIGAWRAELSALRGGWETGHDGADLARAMDDEETMRRAWVEYTARERASRDRLDRAATAAAVLLRDPERNAALTNAERTELARLSGRAQSLLREHGRHPLDGDYEPCSIDAQDALAARIVRIVDGDPANVFDRIEAMLERMDQTLERGKEEADGRQA